MSFTSFLRSSLLSMTRLAPLVPGSIRFRALSPVVILLELRLPDQAQLARSSGAKLLSRAVPDRCSCPCDVLCTVCYGTAGNWLQGRRSAGQTGVALLTVRGLGRGDSSAPRCGLRTDTQLLPGEQAIRPCPCHVYAPVRSTASQVLWPPVNQYPGRWRSEVHVLL